MFKDDESVKFLRDETVVKKLATAKKLSEVDPSQYDAVFYVGGHGPVLDLATDPVNIKVANEVSSVFRAHVARRSRDPSSLVLALRKDHDGGLPRTCVSKPNLADSISLKNLHFTRI